MPRAIVFDLEWNFAQKKQSFSYHGQAMVLHGEIIQIGAVDMDSGREFSVVVKPQRYPKVHSHVMELTGFCDATLAEGLSQKEALSRFRQWCGEDCILLSWSSLDALILRQNLFLQDMGESWPPNFGDIQRAFGAYSGGKAEPSLREAAEYFGLENQLWHDALSDARCTAEVFRRMREQLLPSNAEEELRARSADWKNVRERKFFQNRLSLDSCFLDPELSHITCPHCGALMAAADHWQNGRENRYCYSLLRCPSCQGSKYLLYWTRCKENGLHSFLRGLAEPDQRQLRDWRWRYKKAKLRRRTKEE